MKLLPKWALTEKYPAFYDTESATAIEMTAKVYAAMQELITDYNQFVDTLNAEFTEFLLQGTENHTVFEMKMEQLFNDFVKTITMKYQAQDMVLDNAVSTILSEIPVHLETALNNMYQNGEFDTIVYNSIANLKKDFDSIVNNMNTFQSNINKSFSNLVTDMETFKNNTKSDFEALETELTDKINNLVLDNASADMQKAIYDKDSSGVVDNAEMLGGELPEYYAKQQDLNITNTNIETLNISVNSTISQLTTTQNTATAAKNTADAAKTSADSALSQVSSKLGVNETAADSSKLGGLAAGEYALKVDAINEYTHAKTGVIHYINGSGDNIKFIATADFAAGDLFYVNGSEVAALLQNGETLPADYFKSGHVVSCFLNGAILNFKSGGAGLKIDDITVYSGSDYPASPKENDVFINTNTKTAHMFINGSWVEITYEILQTIIYPGVTPEIIYNSNGNGTSSDVSIFKISVSTTWTNINTDVIYIPVDLTSFNTLTVKGDFSSNNDKTWSGCYLFNQLVSKAPYYTIGQGSDTSNYTLMERVVKNTSSEFIFDVRNLTGMYYIYIGCYANPSSGTATATAQITDVIGE